jgi:hypothetical protein
MGKAANYYLSRRRRGVEVKDLTDVYHQALRDAFRVSKARENVPSSSQTQS